LLFAKVYKRELHPTAYVLIHLAGDADPPWLGKVFEAGSDVGAVAIDAGIVKDNVTLIDADTQAHEARFVYASISLRHRPLDFYCTLGCVNDAAKLRQDPVAGGVNDAAGRAP